jgi:hypothetical protein
MKILIVESFAMRTALLLASAILVLSTACRTSPCVRNTLLVSFTLEDASGIDHLRVEVTVDGKTTTTTSELPPQTQTGTIEVLFPAATRRAPPSAFA